MAVCQAVTVYEEGEDAVKRQKSSTAKIALRLGIPQAGGQGRKKFYLLCGHCAPVRLHAPIAPLPGALPDHCRRGFVGLR